MSDDPLLNYHRNSLITEISHFSESSTYVGKKPSENRIALSFCQEIQVCIVLN